MYKSVILENYLNMSKLFTPLEVFFFLEFVTELNKCGSLCDTPDTLTACQNVSQLIALPDSSTLSYIARIRQLILFDFFIK
jgi:hypothetical protein